MRGIEFDLVLVLGSKVTCFLCGRAKLTVCGPKLSYVECDDRLTWFCVGGGAEIDSVFGCGPPIDWF